MHISETFSRLCEQTLSLIITFRHHISLLCKEFDLFLSKVRIYLFYKLIYIILGVIQKKCDTSANTATSNCLFLSFLLLFFQGAEIRDSEICRRPEARSESAGSLHRVLVGGIATALVQISPYVVCSKIWCGFTLPKSLRTSGHSRWFICCHLLVWHQLMSLSCSKLQPARFFPSVGSLRAFHLPYKKKNGSKIHGSTQLTKIPGLL